MKLVKLNFVFFIMLLNGSLAYAAPCVQSESLEEVMAKNFQPKMAAPSKSVSIESLIDGYHTFKKDHPELFRDLQEGQKPKTIVVACSDSRVDPAIILGANPGDLFVIRNVANLVPPCEKDINTYHGVSAALEFGVNGLGITNIIVIGHSKCAGIRSLFNRNFDKAPQNFVEKWMEIARPAFDLTKKNNAKATVDQQSEVCAHYGVVNSLQNLRKFKWIADKEKSGKLTLHGWFFDIAHGGIQKYDDKTKKWKAL